VKISALISNLATNCIVRSWPILKVLQRHHEVEVIGALFGDDELFPPYAREFDYKIVRWPEQGRLYDGLRRMRAQVTGDVVYAFKPHATSFGTALLERFHRTVPVILDIEDWETWSLHRDEGTLRHRLRLARHLVGEGWSHPHSQKYRYVMERLVPRADAVTVVSAFLKERYGGVLLRHGPDTDVFDPVRYDGKTLRDKWGISQNLRLILFAGTPTYHKGLDGLFEALERAALPDVRVLMAGKGGPPAPWADRVIHVGFQPHALMPELLAMADLVVLPQRRMPQTAAQIPAKVFEAMAMGKLVIASAVSDLPEILDGCGVLVEPEDVAGLTEAISHALTSKQTAEELGWRARERCVEHYSWDAIDRITAGVLRSLP
jgi:glycosyltransferase involved in cell wall biosynthesis